MTESASTLPLINRPGAAIARPNEQRISSSSLQTCPDDINNYPDLRADASNTSITSNNDSDKQYFPAGANNGKSGKVKKSAKSAKYRKGKRWTELGRAVETKKPAGAGADQCPGTPEVRSATVPQHLQLRSSSTDYYDTDFESGR